MNTFAMADSTEVLKARRSKVPWSIAAGFSLAPIVGGLFMVILKNPEGARQLGVPVVIAAKTTDSADASHPVSAHAPAPPPETGASSVAGTAA